MEQKRKQDLYMNATAILTTLDNKSADKGNNMDYFDKIADKLDQYKIPMIEYEPSIADEYEGLKADKNNYKIEFPNDIGYIHNILDKDNKLFVMNEGNKNETIALYESSNGKLKAELQYEDKTYHTKDFDDIVSLVDYLNISNFIEVYERK